jgi:hypothetical protein
MSAIMMVVMMTITMCVMMTTSMMCVITIMMTSVSTAMLCAALGTTLGCCTKQIIERKSKQFHLNLYYTQT